MLPQIFDGVIRLIDTDINLSKKMQPDVLSLLFPQAVQYKFTDVHATDRQIHVVQL